MNQNRSWPGVPNRYSTSRLPMVIRPKSIATVVDVFLSTPFRSSKAMLALVSGSSVRNGRTSLIAPTSVVLPAPKPPATRILNRDCGLSAVPSEGTEPMQYLLEQVGAGLLVGASLRQHGDPALLGEVGEQHPDDAQRQPGVRRHVGHRDRPLAQSHDPAMLRAQSGRLVSPSAPVRDHHHGDEVQHLAVGRLGPAAGDRVGANDRAGVPVDPLVVRAHNGTQSTAPWGAEKREWDTRCGPARFTSIAIS